MKQRFRKFFQFAAGTTPLIQSFIGIMVMLLLVFPALPINGEMIDLKLHYDLADIQAAMLQYGSRGRAVYALASPSLDTLFPLLYVTFFAGLIYRFRPTEGLWVMAFIPVLAGAWDLCENAQITAMLLQYPAISARQVVIASFFTSIKHLLSGVFELTSLVFLLIIAVRRARQAMTERSLVPVAKTDDRDQPTSTVKMGNSQ
jgi:hypothetical protein